MQRGKSFLIAVAAVLALAIGILGAHGSSAQTDRPAWGLVAGVVPVTANLTNVFMLDQNNAWVAGSEGSTGKVYKLQFSNDSWHLVESEDFASPVLALSVVSDNNVWAVGEAGLIAHKDANGWQIVANPVPTARLNTIQMLSTGDEGWAGGVMPGSQGQPVMLHYTDGRWATAPSLHAPDVYRPVNSLHFAANGGYAVGVNQIWRYDGAQWVQDAQPSPVGCLGYYQFNGVRTINRDEAWAAGFIYCSGPRSRALRFCSTV